MVAEALGPECRIVSGGWHAWDLQIGPDEATFPQRLRIQVKNSARLQTWNAESGKLSETTFQLTYRRRPAYFARDFPGVPCEDVGFMCDLFILCHHPIEDPKLADHRDPNQWEFFILPVVGANPAVTELEIAYKKKFVEQTGKPSSTHRRPRTLVQGIRGRPRISPVSIDELSPDLLWRAVT